MVTLLTTLLALSPAAHAQGFTYAAPTEIDVQLIASNGRYDGTDSLIWVRVHSELLDTWSSWQIAPGVDRSAVTALPFSLSPSFGTVDEVDVFIDAQDGARLTVVVDDGTISHMFTPEERWIKGRTKTFARSNLLAVTCCTDPTGGTGCATFEGDVCPDDLTICWGDCGTE